jgi:hypothetical protein
MSRLEFGTILGRLALQLGHPSPDKATLQAYYDALQDVEPEYLAMAAKELAQSSQWFPKTSEWRAAAAKVALHRRVQQAEILRRLPAPLCAACADTGWVLDASERASRCPCQKLRELELLGRRPMPVLPEARPVAALPEMTLDGIKAAIAARKEQTT